VGKIKGVNSLPAHPYSECSNLG